MARLLLCRILPKPEEINVFIFRTSNMKLLVSYPFLFFVESFMYLGPAKIANSI